LNEIYDYWVLVIYPNCMKIDVFGIFPEIAWRVKKCRQATHLHCVIFGFLKRNCLAACPWPLDDAYCAT